MVGVVPSMVGVQVSGLLHACRHPLPHSTRHQIRLSTMAREWQAEKQNYVTGFLAFIVLFVVMFFGCVPC